MSVEAVRGGGTYFSTMAPTILVRHMEELEERTSTEGDLDSLSRREMEVFVLLAGGKSIKEAANELCISPKTVESHKYNIMEKLQAATVVELTKIAVRQKLIEV